MYFDGARVEDVNYAIDRGGLFSAASAQALIKAQ